MTWEFGYNCTHYLPTLRKCRALIDKRRVRADLVEQKWLGTRDISVYLNLSDDDLIRGVASGAIKTKLQKDGKLMFDVSVAAQYDDCYLADSGGVCLWYAEHDGRKIEVDPKGWTEFGPRLDGAAG